MNPTDMPRGRRIAAAWLDQIRAAVCDIPPDQTTVDRVVSWCYRALPCTDCGTPLGAEHLDGCDVARCLHNGLQRIQCDGGECDEDCENTTVGYGRAYHDDYHGEDGPHDCGREIWDGVWPGTEECIELGWFCHFVGPGLGYIPCGPENPSAMADLNRLLSRATWDRDRQRWVAPDGKAAQAAKP